MLEYKKPNLRLSTWSVYEGHVRNHFVEFKDLRINRIHTAGIEAFILERQKEGMPIGTIRKILVSLGQIFKYAVRHKYVSYSPIVDAERPRKNGSVKEYIQMQLGHSFPTVTLNAYSHLMRKQNPEAAARLEEAIF